MPLDHDFTLDEVTVPVLDIYNDANIDTVVGHTGQINSYNSGTGMSYTQGVLDCDAAFTQKSSTMLICV